MQLISNHILIEAEAFVKSLLTETMVLTTIRLRQVCGGMVTQTNPEDSRKSTSITGY